MQHDVPGAEFAPGEAVNAAEAAHAGSRTGTARSWPANPRVMHLDPRAGPPRKSRASCRLRGRSRR